MVIWLPRKAKLNKVQSKRKKIERPRLCRICGKPTGNGGAYCNTCRDFIKRKQREERKGTE